ncbi:MAG: radical SAM protein [Desulfobulbaceae bacterium]|nr:radical SAM protein [Desulfobulbaceae bacterium]
MLAHDRTLLVSEIFYSIQGESSFAGLPCVFIRLAGCNLRCSYCDARYTYEEDGFEKTLDELIDCTGKRPHALVEITGGEPLLQENVYPLIDLLKEEGRTVLLETNGSIPLNRVPAGVIKIMDIKCPDSGMHEKMDFTNLTYLTKQDEIKFVLSSRDDYDWAIKTIERYGLKEKNLLFSPVEGRLQADHLAEWVLADTLPVRIQIQLHKVLWPDRKRGV